MERLEGMKPPVLSGLIGIHVVLSSLLTVGCSGTNPIASNDEGIIVQAYLFANEPVDDIHLTSTVSLDAETGQAPPINDAQVVLIKNSQRYALTLTPGDSGYYHYAGNDLAVEAGDHFTLEITHQSKVITAETIVPETPANVALSSTVLEIFDPSDFFESGVLPDIDSLTIEVTWNNEDGAWFYMVIENIESDPEPIDTDSTFTRTLNFVSRPTQRDSFRISQGILTHLGQHQVRVFRVNQEYADLYESREQDSRDLNEPLTNINNGLGIFSAFNSQTAFFEVIRD
jgi:uncharacterized protein YcfL